MTRNNPHAPSNIVLALVVLIFTIASLYGNYMLIVANDQSAEPTGFAIATGSASFCVNSPPSINISNCSTSANITQEYTCTVVATDPNFGTSFTYSDNTTLFDIDSSGLINFTPNGSVVGARDILLTANDNSLCANSNATDVLNLTIVSSCLVQSPPSFINLSSYYRIDRNHLFSIVLNATDPEDNAYTFSVTEINQTSFSAFGSISTTSSRVSITPDASDVGNHTFNITVTDDSGCEDNSTSQLVVVEVLANNTAPEYIGSPGDLSFSMQEDTTAINIYNLDDYFNDTEGDCLKYEVEFISLNPFVSINIDNNFDPTGQSCPPNHFVSLTPAANQFGEEDVCFRANDTFDVSSPVCINFTVTNVAEPVDLPTLAGEAGGGGGASAGAARILRCEEKWFCDRWSLCEQGASARNCTDINRCETTKFKPNESRACSQQSHCSDGQQNNGELGVDCGGPCHQPCATCNDAIKNCHPQADGTQRCEQGVDCGGPCQECRADQALTQEEIQEAAQFFSPAQSLSAPWIIIGILSSALGFIFWKFRKISSATIFIYSKLLDHFTKKSTRHIPKQTQSVLILQKLSLLDKHYDQYGSAKVLEHLGKLVRHWIKKSFDLDYDNALSTLPKQARQSRKQLFIKQKVEPFVKKLVEVEYSGEQLNDRTIKMLLHRAQELIKATRRSSTPKKPKTYAISIILVMLSLLSFFVIDPSITGFVVYDNTQQINQNYSQSQSIALSSIDELQALSVSGALSSDSDLTIYYGDDIVLDSKTFIPASYLTSNPQDLSSEHAIDLVLSYQNNSNWDSDNDGITTYSDVIDLSVSSSQFSWDADESYLCTLWTVSTQSNTDYQCYGSTSCCNLFELQATRDSWKDTLYLDYSDTEHTSSVVSAQLFFANYSLGDQPYSHIVESDMENATAHFLPSFISFTDYCLDSCSLEQADDTELRLEIRKGILSLDEIITHTQVAIDPPTFSTIPNQSIAVGSLLTIDLEQYTTTPSLVFSASTNEHLIVTFNGAFATLEPKAGFSGTTYLFFVANDTNQLGVSNIVEVDVYAEDLRQGQAKVGEPVQWIARPHNNSITVQSMPLNITARTSEGAVSDDQIYLSQTESEYSLEEYKQPRLVPLSLDESPIEIRVPSTDQLEFEYYTQAPTSSEQELSPSAKRVTISSDIHYTEILAFTDIDEVAAESILLFHVINDTHVPVSFTPYDTNNNGLIDRIEWIVPHLSNQTYEINITVLNVQSYPIVGGSWEVRFITSGKADLRILAINDTTYGAAAPDDLSPTQLRCGDTPLSYQWVDNEVTYSDYECNETGYWIATVHTVGIHNQQLNFGNATGYANNLASVASNTSNLTIWDDRDIDGADKFAADNITFYANYTNGTQIANGTCSISFNFTGSLEDETNMTYNGNSLPWNYSRTIPYKGTSYFNVLCLNDTMPTLNVTDDIFINNSPPTFNITAGKFPALVCTEDTICTFNISPYAIDPDMNDNLTFDYSAGSINSFTSHADCSSCWQFDFTNGLLNISVTTSNHANDGPWSPDLIVRDTDEVSDSGTLDFSVTAVNDVPIFTQPSGGSLTSATTETAYNYQLVATDEEDGSTINYSYSVISCERAYDPGNCDALTLVLNTTSGAINFTPVNNDAGNYTLNLSAADTLNSTASIAVSFTIDDINNAPAFEHACNATRSAIEDTELNCVINGTDPENDTLTFSANASWFTIQQVSASQSLANFTPTNAEVGNHTINLTVSDGFLTDNLIINFSVNNSNDPPTVFNISNQTAIVGLDLRFNISTVDDDFLQPGNTFQSSSENLTFTVNSSLFEQSKVNDTALQLNYTALEADKGNYTVEVNVTDLASAVVSILFDLSVRNNTAPIFDYVCNDTTSIREEVLSRCHVNVTDLEADNFTFSANASWFAINNSGNVTLLVNDSEVGNHTVNITVTDIWQLQNSLLFTLTVNNTAEAPQFNLTSLVVDEGSTYSINLNDNATDQDQLTPFGDQLTFGVNSTFSGRMILNSTTGEFNFTPINDDVGSFVLNFSANDSTLLTTDSLVSIIVNNVNQPPNLTFWCQNQTIAQEDSLYTCQVAGVDPDVGDAINFTADVVGSSNWFIMNDSGYVSFTPTNSEVGNHTINISISDGTETTFELLSLSVNNTNDAPTLGTIGALDATEDQLFYLGVNATDVDTQTPDNDTLSFTTNSTLFTINVTSGNVSFTPNLSDVGRYQIIFNVTDLAGASDTSTVTLNISEFNDAPNLIGIANFTLEESSEFYLDLNATDEEDNSSDLRFRTNASFFTINATSGVINFTPSIAQVGVFVINVTVNDTGGAESSDEMILTILEFNFLPNITQIRPYGTPLANTTFAFANRTSFPDNTTNITVSENTSVIFNHSSVDLNGESLNSTWIVDGSEVQSSNTTHYTYDFSFLSAGSHLVKLVVLDTRFSTDNFTWNVTTTDVNRLPLFGTILHDDSSDFSGGSNNETNVTSSGIILSNVGDTYSYYGEFISAAIDIGPLFSSFYSPLAFTNISWSEVVPNGTNVSLQTRSSQNGVDWNNWSNVITGLNYTNAEGEPIASENATFIQYKIILQTNSTNLTPNVSRVQIEYILPDLTLEEGDSNSNWIDLDDYFTDLDSDDTLTFSISGASELQLSINNLTSVVSIVAPTGFSGSEVLTFVANDSSGLFFSNNLTVTVQDTESISSIEIVTLTTTKTKFKTRTRTITEPRYLEILSPKHITVFDDDTVVAPLVLKNNGESILNGITLSAESSSDEIELEFSDNFVETLAPGQSVELDLFATWQGLVSEFDIIVNASATDPDFTDSAILSVTGVTRVTSERAVEESQIEFVRDLLQNNPECLELTELLLKAEQLASDGSLDESRNTINFVIESCRFLVTSQRGLEQLTPIEQRGEDLYKLISGILLLIVFITTVIIIALARKRK